jgi:KDO2-lipid IV(A) lauroyltransferase
MPAEPIPTEPMTAGGPAAVTSAPLSTSAETGAERKRERLAFWGYRAAEGVISALPRGVVLPVSAAAGNAAYDVAGDKRAVVRDNLAHAMGLPADDPQVDRAARRAFRNYARYLADVMRLAGEQPEDVGALVDISNIQILHEARAEERGVLLCTVHVGGMDLIAPALKVQGQELHVVADDTTYGRLYEHLKQVRARHGLTLIGWRNLRGLFRALKAGENLVLFCDGGYRAGDVPVEFLGEATTFPAGPATLSARSGAPMLPVACQRTRGDRFAAHGLPLIRATSDEPAEIFRATQALADALGTVIRADPGQWYMFRPVWPQTDGDRARAQSALEVARRGEDWTRAGGA